MAKITLGNNPANTSGYLPKIGEQAKDFCLIGKDLEEVSLNNFQGERIIMNIFPCIKCTWYGHRVWTCEPNFI